jgi:hypothetical protein
MSEVSGTEGTRGRWVTFADWKAERLVVDYGNVIGGVAILVQYFSYIKNACNFGQS